MEIKQSEFITSAVTKSQYPQDGRLEVAFVGRSNVGKSSIINSLTNRRHLAKVSNTPGKTRLVNFFLINNDFYLVDLPGYGYAKVSKTAKETWGKVIETYLVGRSELRRLILLVDCRRVPTEDDIIMYNWIKHYGYEIIIVATKSDKLTKNELKSSEVIIRKTFNLNAKDVLFFFSSLKKDRKDDLVNVLFNDLSQEITK